MREFREYKLVEYAPVIDTALLASGDVITTTVIELTGVSDIAGGFVQLVRARLFDDIAQNAPLELWLFDRSVTAAAANAPHALTDADRLFCVGILSFGASDYTADANGSVAEDPGLTYEPGMVIKLRDGSTSLYAMIVSRGTPTYTGAGNLKGRLTFRQYRR